MNIPHLESLSETQIHIWGQQAHEQATRGRVIDRIAPLACANPDWFAVQILCGDKSYSFGDTACHFPLMSVIKPFLLLALLDQAGVEAVGQWVGSQPSALPFNSLDQLIADQGYPRNPMINSGAITLADKLSGDTAADRCAALSEWLNQQAKVNLVLDPNLLTAVRQSDRSANLALISYLAQANRVQNSDLALDTYEQICCLSGTVSDLARLGLLLALDQNQLESQHRQLVNDAMVNCGLYEASADYATRIGLPMKSGISGALIAVVPDQGAIACYSPALDRVGNPVASLTFVEQLVQELPRSSGMPIRS